MVEEKRNKDFFERTAKADCGSDYADDRWEERNEAGVAFMGKIPSIPVVKLLTIC
ncbi:hypothetical protein ABXS75_03740 [Roseburia hominis]